MTHPRSPEASELVSEVMHTALDLEQQYQRWEETQSKETVAWVDNIPGGDITKADVCPGRVDLYPDVFACSSWNFARVSRIFIASIVIRCAAWICYPVDYRTTPEYAQMSRMAQEMIGDIIASVPFMFGWHLDAEGRLKPGDVMGGEDVMGVKALGGVYTIWPLLSASCSDFTTDSQRTWIKGRFKFIAEVMGLNQAKVVACVSFSSLLDFQLFHPFYPISSLSLVFLYPSSKTQQSENKLTPSTQLQLRLPSMIVRRDNMGYAPPNTVNSVRPLGKPAIMPTLPSSISSLTFQQREAMRRDMWERERKAALERERENQSQGGGAWRQGGNVGVNGGNGMNGQNGGGMGMGNNGRGVCEVSTIGGGNQQGMANVMLQYQQAKYGLGGGNGGVGAALKTGELSWKVSNEQGKKYAWLEGLGWWETTV